MFNVLLQVLDDGRLTDGQGRTVDFRNVLIIMTSNLGSDYLALQKDGEDTAKVRDDVMSVVRGHFRPEFLNRVDEIILFHRLRRDDMAAIVDIQFARLAKLLVDRKITPRPRPQGPRLAGRQGLRPSLWGPALEARDPEGRAGPSGRDDPRRRGARRRDGAGYGGAERAEDWRAGRRGRGSTRRAR